MLTKPTAAHVTIFTRLFRFFRIHESFHKCAPSENYALDLFRWCYVSYKDMGCPRYCLSYVMDPRNILAWECQFITTILHGQFHLTSERT